MQRENENFLFCLEPGALRASAEPTMVQGNSDGLNKDMVLPPTQQRPARKKLRQNSVLGFLNLLSVNETQTRYRGWLVRRVCCLLFVMGRRVPTSPVRNRLEKIFQNTRVQKTLAAEQNEEGGVQGQRNSLSSFLPLIHTRVIPALLRFVGWALLKMFSSTFDNIQVNLSHLAALHRASKEGSLLLYVHVRQSFVDSALIPLVLFCHNLKLPYVVCPLQIKSYCLRTVLQKVGVILLPPSALTEQDAEKDRVYSAVMKALLGELLHEGQPISVGLSPESGQGGQWLASVTHLVRESSVTDVTVVPVGISYDCVPKTSKQVGFGSVLLWLCSSLWRKSRGSVRIHFAQPFSLKEMCTLERWTVDKWRPLQDVLLPVVLKKRIDSGFGRRRMSWLLPSSYYPSELQEPTELERDRLVAIILHLIFSATSCTAVMSTSLVSSLLLYRHRKASFNRPRGVSVSVLCRDVVWLTEEVLFRNKDVGFGGSVTHVVHYALSLLAPHLLIAAAPTWKDPFIACHPSLAATLHLSNQANIITHTFILEAVGACAVSAMLCEVVASGVSSSVKSGGVDGEKVKGDMDFDVVLCQSELIERALQLCHLLPPGFLPPCQSSQSFALDAVESLVRCGILVMEEIARSVPICDTWNKDGMLKWSTSDDPYQSDTDCDEQEQHSYKISQPSRCPEMLFFLCNMLAAHLRALCWTTAGLELSHTPLPSTCTTCERRCFGHTVRRSLSGLSAAAATASSARFGHIFSPYTAGAEFVAQVLSHLCDTANKKQQHYESCSEEAAHSAVRTLIDLGVLLEEAREGDGAMLEVSPLFHQSENRLKLTRFISQYLYN
ncbi:Glycerol-3-phosphate acyltransferase 1, mitochondrial [Takifugu flavidus]|uniref:Glycerol-3-phosphate acyltransferase 1, mitochondrial n=1 Tax=Takifugu flavidus TaxID=433684 RepID=A0A5C6MZI4_9TELE|nr:Glycerol-3-phosphate acyltransferase 1, mitochondrial [Takifugu flavidus]